MKANFGTRVLSVVLCTVMLFSCWVFTAPSASAATWYAGNSSTKNNTVPSTSAPTEDRNGKYRVRIVLFERGKLDKTVHDNTAYTPGITFGLNNSQRNLNGNPGFNNYSSDKGTNKEYWCEYAKITYKDLNGTGTEGAVWFNIGDYDAQNKKDCISGGNSDYGYFPSSDGVVIDGFPTGFKTRIVNYENRGWPFPGDHGYHAYLQVAKWTNSGWNWDDYGGTETDNSLDSGRRKGIADGEDYRKLAEKGESNGDEFVVEATVDASKFPYATTGTASVNSTTAKTTAPTVKFTTTSSTTQVSDITLPSKSGTTYSRRVYYTDPYDQYGAVMASTIQLNYSQSGKKSYFTQDGTTTSFAYGANISGNTDTQQLRAKVTWPSASNAATELSTYSNELTVNDASYTVSFKSENGSATYTTDPSSFQYGHTPAYNGTTPTKTDTANNPQVYTYTHDGWSATANGTKLTSLPAVTGDSNKTFYAHFSESKIDYTVKFVNNNNTEISSVDYNIGDTLTEPDSALIPHTYQSVDKVYTFTGWVGTNGEVYDGTCHGAITYKPVYSDVPRQYTVTFQEEDGTVISSRDLDYGTVPSSVTGLVPALIDKDPDDTNHYTPAWSQSLDTGITGDTVFRIVYTGTPHELGEATTKTEATCTETGIDVQTCSVCNHEVETETPINPNKHNFALNEPAVADGANTDETPIYYHCDRCDKYFRAGLQKNAQNNYEYVPITDEGAVFSTSADAELDTSRATVPSPTFNSNSSDAQFYDVPYSNRPSQMRLTDKNADGTKTNQTVRFVGSVKIPSGVDYKVNLSNDADNVVLDFGFVWTQTMYICDGYTEGSNPNPEKLKYIPKNKEASGELGYKIQKMSVVSKNQTGDTVPVMDSTASNWTGCTHWTANEGRDHYYSFNLVVSIKPGNWSKEYCARPYITYKYHGQTYTVYDAGTSNTNDDGRKYNHESVVSLATKIMAKNYLALGSVNRATNFSIIAAMKADGINISDIKDYNNALNRVARDKRYVETKGIFSDELLNLKTTTNIGLSASRPNYEWISSALTESTTYRFTDKTFK